MFTTSPTLHLRSSQCMVQWCTVRSYLRKRLVTIIIIIRFIIEPTCVQQRTYSPVSRNYSWLIVHDSLPGLRRSLIFIEVGHDYKATTENTAHSTHITENFLHHKKLSTYVSSIINLITCISHGRCMQIKWVENLTKCFRDRQKW